DFDADAAGAFDLADARRRPQVVGDAVGAAEAGGGDDFFVVDTFVAVAGFGAERGVPLARDGTHLEIGWHDCVSPRSSSEREVTASAPEGRHSVARGVSPWRGGTIPCLSLAPEGRHECIHAA